MNQKNKTVKVAAVSPLIRLGDVAANVKAFVREAKRAASLGARVIVFPELSLTGATCGDLFMNPTLTARAERGLREFIDETRELDILSFIGLPATINGDTYNVTASVYRGKLFALVPNDAQTYEEQRYFRMPPEEEAEVSFAGFDIVFSSRQIIKAPFDKSFTISIGVDAESDSAPRLTVCQMANEARVGSRPDSSRHRLVLLAHKFSYSHSAAVVYATAGIGESTTDAVYCAHNIIADRGRVLAEAVPFAEDNLIMAEIELLAKEPLEEPRYDFDAVAYQETALPKNPFLPTDEEEQRGACLEALEIQAQALAARVERSYSKTMVIGVSGGLDSTLALLVAARAADILGRDRKCIIGVTMPCFGTTKRTKSNAEKLSDALGISFRTVDIKKSVVQHLSDIGHDGVTPDVTYENAQARERTQVLMDISNMTGGLVVGTGDLSELVLGWATYNGDHMSMYAVNASVPKTMVRRIVEVYSDEAREKSGEISAVLDDILATPVSPELLPPKDGEIAQCTEALVGPYELHDFFIYCTLFANLSVRETYELTKASLGGVYDNKTILSWLRVFLRRFLSQQFKRSCMPDGPRVSCISVSPRGGLRMPSDISAAVWLEELDEIEKEEK
ncbi:MAG: NAD(+) synthase [Clostridia bacterium]|nr:NAD(+) synthase [Clostridia bacterium]